MGRRFESCRAHHVFKTLTSLPFTPLGANLGPIDFPVFFAPNTNREEANTLAARALHVLGSEPLRLKGGESESAYVFDWLGGLSVVRARRGSCTSRASAAFGRLRVVSCQSGWEESGHWYLANNRSFDVWCNSSGAELDENSDTRTVMTPGPSSTGGPDSVERAASQKALAASRDV